MANKAKAQMEQESIISGRRGNLLISSGPSSEVHMLKPPNPKFSQVAAPDEKPASVRMAKE